MVVNYQEIRISIRVKIGPDNLPGLPKNPTVDQVPAQISRYQIDFLAQEKGVPQQ
jgi:hypothetical protein